MSEEEAAGIEVEDRRARVIALYSKGLNQAEIAEKLAVNQSTVSRDLQEMRNQSRKEIEKHVIKDALFEFYRWAAGMDEMTKKAWEIVEDEKAAHKSKMKALSFLVGCYNRRLKMMVGGSEKEYDAQAHIQEMWEGEGPHIRQ
jgi:DNA-binding transcriptional regulator LsrR (DeoR family)